MEFNYFYGKEADEFVFYRLPKLLVVSEEFKDVSYGGKLLYGILLDRMGLSISNGWFDDENRAYIIYTVEEIKESLNCSKGTAIKMLAEIEGIGLIEQKKRGRGYPDHIYVKKFYGEGVDNSDVRVQNMNLKKSEICTSGSSETEIQEVQNLDHNNTNINNTEINNINSIISYPQMTRKDYEKIVKENIEYDILKIDFKGEWLDNIVELMLDVLCSKSEYIRINKEDIPIEQVRKRYFSINDQHIRYLDDAFHKNTSDVRNIRAFFITALYNATVTMDAFYEACVNHDLREGKLHLQR